MILIFVHLWWVKLWPPAAFSVWCPVSLVHDVENVWVLSGRRQGAYEQTSRTGGGWEERDPRVENFYLKKAPPGVSNTGWGSGHGGVAIGRGSVCLLSYLPGTDWWEGRQEWENLHPRNGPVICFMKGTTRMSPCIDHLGLMPFLLSITNPTAMSGQSYGGSFLTQGQLYVGQQSCAMPPEWPGAEWWPWRLRAGWWRAGLKGPLFGGFQTGSVQRDGGHPGMGAFWVLLGCCLGFSWELLGLALSVWG